MTTREKIAVMQAFEDGKKIEIRVIHSDNWIFCECPGWNWEYFNYRVKPEPAKPKYREIEIITEMGLTDKIRTAGWRYLNAWPCRPNFVGFRMEDGSISPVPVVCFTLPSTGLEMITKVIRATHVIVEEK